MDEHVTRARAKHLRRKMTAAEVALWQRLRRKQLGVRFRRQYPIGPFIADFCCTSARLIIELDGQPHYDMLADDGSRSDYLRSLGFRILRFDNDELGAEDGMQRVLQDIKRALRSEI